MGKKLKKSGWHHPCASFGLLWCERNRVVFENEVLFAQKIKAKFLSNLWNWANLYSVNNTNSLLDFLTWMGSR